MSDDNTAHNQTYNLAELSSDSPEFLALLFKVINQSHLDNSLLDCRVKWSDRIGTGKHGHRVSDFTVFDDPQFLPVIRLSKRILLNDTVERISEALYYAMVHVWLWHNKQPWGHTKEFFDKAKEFDFEKVKNISDIK